MDFSGARVWVVIRKGMRRPGEGKTFAMVRWPGGLDVPLEWPALHRVIRASGFAMQPDGWLVRARSA